MKKFTKVMALLLSLSMVLCFAACGGTTEETTAPGGEETTAADVAYDLTKEGDYTADNTEYLIGATGPLTGDAASYGISVQQGAQLAVEEINAAGGLNGVNFKLDIKDDKAKWDVVPTKISMDEILSVDMKPQNLSADKEWGGKD